MHIYHCTASVRNLILGLKSVLAQAKKHEVARLQNALDKHEETDKAQRETIACVTRHWCALTEELKSTLQRLEKSSVAIDTAQHAKMLESFSILKVAVLFSLQFERRRK